MNLVYQYQKPTLRLNSRTMGITSLHPSYKKILLPEV